MKRIMLVEDSEAQRFYMMVLLSQENYLVNGCSSFAEAFQSLRCGSLPDLILCDFFLPDHNGLELLELTRRMKGGDKVKFILMTAGSPLYIEHYSSKINDLNIHVLFKPFEPPNMIEMVKALTSE